MPRIALIPGDGIGGEVLNEAARVLERVSHLYDVPIETVVFDFGAERFLRTGISISEDEFEQIANEFDAILLGALGDPRVPSNQHARDILLGLRFRLDLYVNYRPCLLLHPSLSPLKEAEGREIAMHVFRENTEGVYVDMGGTFKQGTVDEVAIQEDINTRKGVERIVRAAFGFARDHSLGRVTLVDKANAMPAAGGLWRRVFAEVSGEFEDVRHEAMYVDAMAMDLLRRPERYEVIVTCNLFGDIISDLGAEITGGLGLAASANVHPGRHALFEPVHGSAPDIAGRGVANPLGAVRCVGLMFEYLGFGRAAEAVQEAVRASVTSGRTTPDLGGSASTVEVGDALVASLESLSPV